MALGIGTATQAVFVEASALFNDLARIIVSQFLTSARTLISSPLAAIAVLADLPNLLIERVGDSPRLLVQRLMIQLQAFPLDRSLRSRVMTGNQARSWCMFATAAQLAELAQPPVRATLERGAKVFGVGGVKGWRARLEGALGKLTLSAAETTVGKVLAVILSPARLILTVLRLWDLTVSLAIVIVGFGLLTLLYASLSSKEGKDTIKELSLSQRRPRRRILVISEGPPPGGLLVALGDIRRFPKLRECANQLGKEVLVNSKQTRK